MILLAGIGNIFLGDDAFGVEVIARLRPHDLGADVRVMDYGIRSYDLAFALLDAYDTAILVDTVSRGGAPGSLYLIEPGPEHLQSDESQFQNIDAHSMNPFAVLRMVTDMGGTLPRVLVLGCEPETFGPEEGAMGLSESVEAAVTRALTWIPQILTSCRTVQSCDRQGAVAADELNNFAIPT